ncbi:hypothetical protein KH5_09080 [Urechidicola sp. KH5]
MKALKTFKKLLFALVFVVNQINGQSTVVVTGISNNDNDTVEQDKSTGNVVANSSDLEFCYDGGSQLVGVRFQNVNVPKDAVITEAFIQFQVDEVSTGAVTIRIFGIDVDNATQFNTDNYNISNRIDGTISSATAASVNWTPNDWNNVGDVGLDQRTGNIRSIVQELVNRGGWSVNNAMAFVFEDESNSLNKRTAEKSAANTLELHISYAIGPQEIEVLGNNVDIENNDNTPSLLDDTDFDVVSIGQSAIKTYTIQNIGSQTLNLSGISVTGDAEFQMSTLPNKSSLDGGESTTFSISYTPAINGVINTANVIINSDDTDESSFNYSIHGEGIVSNAEIIIQDAYATSITNESANSPSLINSTDFGGTDVFTSTSKTYRIVNTGATDLLIGTVSSSNSDFVISQIPIASLEPNNVTTFEITFSPVEIGQSSSEITIINNDSDENPFTFTVKGDGYSSQQFLFAGDVWNYYDDGNTPPSNGGYNWTEIGFNDSSWSSGNAELGYGDGDETTSVDNRAETVYFRKSFNVSNHTSFSSLNLEAIRDDGMVVYLNGNEVWRNNMPSGPISYDTYANATISGSSENSWIQTNVSNLLVTGTNIVAVEVHQRSSSSSDISFNFRLSASSAPNNNSTVRGPYLQMGTSNSVVIRWRTETPTDTKVNYGTTLGALNHSVSNTALSTDHEIELIGLTPNTKYYYEIEDAGGVYVTQNIDMFYLTAPLVGTTQFVRAWILGDAGTANQNQRDVRDAYYNYAQSAVNNPNQTDMMLFLGDNAYNSGTDSEYQAAFYDVYDKMLSKSVAWSTLGNHDGYSSGDNSNGLQTGPYYSMFTFPTAAEVGGVASGTEAYYSFDYANIHFIVLESYHKENNAAQLTWLENDIASTTQDWIVALYHHPSYTKGSHDSDAEGDLEDVRANFLPRLEAGGVDLVLNGHSHSYERSYFLNGHYGKSNTFNSVSHTVGVNGDLSGKADTADGAYSKDVTDADGAVYITTGSAGKISGGSLNHPAMYASLNRLGSCVMEIENIVGGQKLTVKFIRENGAIDDYFTIEKSGVNLVLGLEDQALENALVYPVPSNGFLNIDLNYSEKLEKARFYNAVGSLVKETNKTEINVSNLKPGVYMLEITSDKNTYYKSIIIN